MSNADTTTTALTDFVMVSIDSIQVGQRYRVDATVDLDKLVDSIKSLGLLHPVVVTADRKLVAGQRRILAYQKLGKGENEAHIISNLDDADFLLGEHDENVCRVPFTDDEALALFNARMEILKPLAEERQKAGKPAGQMSTRSRDAAAKGLGVSGRTMERKAAKAAGKAPAKKAPAKLTVVKPDKAARPTAKESAMRDIGVYITDLGNVVHRLRRYNLPADDTEILLGKVCMIEAVLDDLKSQVAKANTSSN